jgi:methylenetetrahydrofolate dehydrogenase (NADP+)/methenyltetrahydrofolate cyclohydrolase
VSARILDGKSIAEAICEETTEQVAEFIDQYGVVPALAAVLVGDDPASNIYVRNKQRACQRVGIESQLRRLPANVPADELMEQIVQLNQDPRVHGILVQLPMPDQIDTSRILDAVSPRKDVDAFHPENVGLVLQGRPRFLPCTPHGIQQLLHRNHIPVAGRHVVVVGRSDIVGKPLAMMLIQRRSDLGEGAVNATVTICHSQSRDLAQITRQADILVVAAGRPGLITAAMVRPGAAVVDVGMNRTDQGLVGDVDFRSVQEVAGWITPVPGGVGPLTVAMLLRNTLHAARIQRKDGGQRTKDEEN